MKSIFISLCMFPFCLNAYAQTGSYSFEGYVMDNNSRAALPGATVAIKNSSLYRITDNAGHFYFEEVSQPNIVLLVSYIGYATMEKIIDLATDKNNPVSISLSQDHTMGNTVVISASRRPEKIVNAPASIQVISNKELQQFAGSNVSELVSRIQGVEYTRSGLNEITFNARGFNSAFNNKMMLMIDGRNCMAPLSASLPIFGRQPTQKDDIDRIEIVLGPQNALFGPNAHNAVFNYISKDPRKYPGTTVAVSAGNHDQFSARIRQATKLNDKWAFKLTGEYATGKEFNFYDSVFDVPGPRTSIPERVEDFRFRNLRGEAALYYSVSSKADIIISGGGSLSSWLQVTTSGRNQMKDVSNQYLQARYVSPHFFATVYNSWGSLGSSYPISPYTKIIYSMPSAVPFDTAKARALGLIGFKENSERTNADVQYNYQFQKAGLFLVAGANFQQERPNGYGKNLLDASERIVVDQYGGTIQLEKTLPWGLRAFVATRIDHHENFGNFFAPKFALIKKLGDGTIRVSWARAYSMPSILTQYASIAKSLYGNATGVSYIPDRANKNDIQTIPGLKPEQVSTWEIGYKASIANNFFVDLNYYNGLSKNFISSPRLVAGRVLTVNSIPVHPIDPGIITNDTLHGGKFSTYFNYGEVRVFGFDAGLTYRFNKFITASLRYSWFGSKISRDKLVKDETSLNAPTNRIIIVLDGQHFFKDKFNISIVTRWLEQYDFYSGAQVGTKAGEGTRTFPFNYDHGPLGGFVSVDLSAGYLLNKLTRLNVSITNLFNVKQVEFVGSPPIGRLLMAELKVDIPSNSPH